VIEFIVIAFVIAVAAPTLIAFYAARRAYRTGYTAGQREATTEAQKQVNAMIDRLGLSNRFEKHLIP
jgi:hypothetical protein